MLGGYTLLAGVGGMADVLLVDDNLDTCRLLLRLLGRLGHKVECIGSGAAAMKFLHEHALPQLMVLDYMMPDMDGLAVLKAIRADRQIAELPVVLYTASDDSEVHLQAKSLGVNDVWVKGWVDVAEMDLRIKKIAESKA